MSRNAAVLRRYDEDGSFLRTVISRPTSPVPTSIGISVKVNWNAAGTSMTGLTIETPPGSWLTHKGTVAWTVNGLKEGQAVTIDGLRTDRPLHAEERFDRSSPTLTLTKQVELSPMPMEDTSLGDYDDPITKESRRVLDYSVTVTGPSSGTANSYLVIDTSGKPVGGTGGSGGSYEHPCDPEDKRRYGHKR